MDDRQLDADSSPVSALVNHPHYPVGHVLLKNRRLFASMGIEDPLAQKLGKGAFGHAFKVPLLGDSVLKLTRDPTEMQAAFLLRGKKSRRIVHVYDVWAIPGTFHKDLRGWYLIHREYLHPLSKRDKNLIENLFALFDDENLDLVIPRSQKQHATLAKWRGYIRDMLGGEGPVSGEGEDGVLRFGATHLKKEVQRAMILLIQIGEAVEEMRRAGIDWEDIHSDNMLRNAGGDLVIGDIGWGLMQEDFEQQIPWLTPEVAAAYVAANRPRPHPPEHQPETASDPRRQEQEATQTT